jgi:hypothetical protein
LQDKDGIQKPNDNNYPAEAQGRGENQIIIFSLRLCAPAGDEMFFGV